MKDSFFFSFILPFILFTHPAVFWQEQMKVNISLLSLGGRRRSFLLVIRTDISTSLQHKANGVGKVEKHWPPV